MTPTTIPRLQFITKPLRCNGSNLSSTGYVIPLSSNLLPLPQQDGTTCGDKMLYASTLKFESAECGSIRLIKMECCLKSILPTKFPSKNPTKIPMANLMVTPMQNLMENPMISAMANPSKSPSLSFMVSPMPLAMPIPLPYRRSNRVEVQYVPWDKLLEEYLVAAITLYYNQLMLGVALIKTNY